MDANNPLQQSSSSLHPTAPASHANPEPGKKDVDSEIVIYIPFMFTIV